MKNIGFVSYWFNRGQAVVTKSVKSIFDNAGYNTHVLVRSAKSYTGKGDWDCKNLTIGSKEYDMPTSTYVDWAKKNKIDICFFDQNYQFEQIKALKDIGVKTIGRFVWEQFGKKHVSEAKEAFDIIYSLTQCEHDRYINDLGIDSHFIRWGVDPALLKYSIHRRKDNFIWFYYPAGYCSNRKAPEKVIKAFNMVKNKNIRLFISSQKPLNTLGDKRILLKSGNILSHEKFHKMMYTKDVCIIPSRWEGLGLAFAEAIAFRMPIITTNYGPMNEYVIDNKTGLLVNCNTNRKRANGCVIAEISVNHLAEQIDKLSNKGLINRMSKNTANILQERYSWEKTSSDYLDLIRKV